MSTSVPRTQAYGKFCNFVRRFNREHLVLAEIVREGDQRQTWELGVALRDFYEPGDRNPLLQQAWERLPFSREAKEARGAADAQ
jgi:hypothetical protein